jgi:acyl-coenzyme A synthetase/AMP-(fatty) acid ligase
LPRTASGKLRRGVLRESTVESIGSIKPQAR